MSETLTLEDQILLNRGINLIKIGKLSIHAEIRFDDEQHENLRKLMYMVSPEDKYSIIFLSKRDRFFKYDIEREMWHGSEESYELPYISLDSL